MAVALLAVGSLAACGSLFGSAPADPSKAPIVADSDAAQLLTWMKDIDKKLTWPASYHPSLETLLAWALPKWKSTGQNVNEDLARAGITTWNQCAWVAEAVDRSKSGKPVKDAFAAYQNAGRLSGLQQADGGAFDKELFDKMGLGDPTLGQQFLDTNCAEPLKTA